MIKIKDLKVEDKLTVRTSQHFPSDKFELVVSAIGKYNVLVLNNTDFEQMYSEKMLNDLQYYRENKMLEAWRNKEWDKLVGQLLETYGQGLFSNTPKDIKKYCKNYDKLSKIGKKSFWIFLLSCMAKKESNFKTECVYQENFKDQNGNYVRSTGLFQLSIESLRAYGFKGIEADLFKADVNIKWAIIILNEWVSRDKCIGLYYRKWWGKKVYLGGGRYWSVLRYGNAQKWIRKTCLIHSKSLS